MSSRQSSSQAHAQSGTLPLSLPVAPNLPGPIRPEHAIRCAAPFDAPDWRFTVDWDGARTLLYAGADGRLRLQDELGGDVSERYPELVTAGGQFGGRPAVLDGVVAVVDAEGRPDLRALGDRLCGATGSTRRPVVYLATDLLHVDGASTLRWSLDRRDRALRRLGGTDLRVQVCDVIIGDGTAFAEAASGRGVPAVLARRGRAAYHPGMHSPDRLRIPLEDRAEAAVVGVETGRGDGVIVHLAEQAEGRWVSAGATRIDRPRAAVTWLRGRIGDLRLADPPAGFISAAERTQWLAPRLVATVRHRGRHAGGALRGIEVITLRDDVDPARCIRRAPAPPPVPGNGGFRPTVLHGLPLPEPL